MKTIKIIFILLLFAILTTGARSQDTPEDIKKKILEAYDFFNTRDVTKDKAMKYIDENYTDHTPDPGQAPGIEGFVQSFANLKKGYPDYKITVNDIFFSKEDNKAAVLITLTGTNTGEMMGMPPTGKSINVGGIDYLVFKNGKCIDRWGYFDMMAMMSQLGIMK